MTDDTTRALIDALCEAERRYGEAFVEGTAAECVWRYRARTAARRALEDHIAALQARAGEPVAWMSPRGRIVSSTDARFNGTNTTGWAALYAAPPWEAWQARAVLMHPAAPKREKPCGQRIACPLCDECPEDKP